MIDTSLFYCLFTLLLIVMNFLLWHSIWGRSLIFPTPNITPFATYYHVGTRGDVWWLQCIDSCPPYSSETGDRHALVTQALRSEYAMILTSWPIQRLPSHHYFIKDIYYRLLLRGGIDVSSVFIYEVGSADVECADFTCIVFTSLYAVTVSREVVVECLADVHDH